MGTLMNYVHFHYNNLLFFVACRTEIGRNSPGSLGHHVTTIHTHFLWRTNLLTQISFKVGVSSASLPRARDWEGGRHAPCHVRQRCNEQTRCSIYILIWTASFLHSTANFTNKHWAYKLLGFSVFYTISRILISENMGQRSVNPFCCRVSLGLNLP